MSNFILMAAYVVCVLYLIALTIRGFQPYLLPQYTSIFPACAVCWPYIVADVNGMSWHFRPLCRVLVERLNVTDFDEKCMSLGVSLSDRYCRRRDLWLMLHLMTIVSVDITFNSTNIIISTSLFFFCLLAKYHDGFCHLVFIHEYLLESDLFACNKNKNKR